MKTNITYIDHSGFLVEWDTCYFLFDYYKGEIPKLDSNKMLVVFVSHEHGDHFNPDIFRLYREYPNTTYLISSDIKINDHTRLNYGITDELFQLIKIIKPNLEYELFDNDNNSIHISTLKSTDSGVAFVIRYRGKTVYHAGDLNLWVWMGETKQYNNDMRARFLREISKLEGSYIDIAFAPLDPRQEEWYHLGMDELIKGTDVKYLFPMHFWDKPEIIQIYINEPGISKLSTTIMDIKKQGQQWSIEI